MERHRNGVAGHPFSVGTDDSGLTVKFSGASDAQTIPWSDLDELAAFPAGEPLPAGFRTGVTQFRAARRLPDNRTLLVAYDSDGETFVGIYRDDLGDVPFATVRLQQAKDGDVRFFHNSWRGDSMFDAVLRSPGNNINELMGWQP